MYDKPAASPVAKRMRLLPSVDLGGGDEEVEDADLLIPDAEKVRHEAA